MENEFWNFLGVAIVVFNVALFAYVLTFFNRKK